MTPPPQATPNLSAELGAVLVALGVVLWGLDLPLVEDGLFWWVPQGLLAAEAHVEPGSRKVMTEQLRGRDDADDSLGGGA